MYHSIDHMHAMQLTESGSPEEESMLATLETTLEEGVEGDVLEHRVVHGFRWYRVRLPRRMTSYSEEVTGQHTNEQKGERADECLVTLERENVTERLVLIINKYTHYLVHFTPFEEFYGCA